MKEIQKTFYKCEYCGKEFDVKSIALNHERMMHKCPMCEHNYWLYGVEQRCDLGNTGCRFKEKVKK